MVQASPTDCARARESVSVQLDGELPELEFDRLETHLRFCPACSAWADEVRDVTARLRDAAPEVPADGFMLPGRARRWRVSSAVALASAAAVVATMFVAPGRQQATHLHFATRVSQSAPGLRPSVPRTARLDDSEFAAAPASQPATFRAGRVAF
jgi:predicted anti-sigma-YlaC factor YlaD